MPVTWCLPVLFFVAFLCGAAAEPSCIAIEPTTLPEPCASLNPSTWAFVDGNVSGVEAQLGYMWALQLGIQGFGVLTPSCMAWSQLFFCQAPIWDQGPPPLRSCVADETGAAAAPATRAPICQDMCTSFLQACAGSFKRLGPGLEQLFPPTYCERYSNDGVVLNEQRYPCWNATISEPVISPNLVCPEYSQKTPQGYCQPTCPSPEFSADQVFNIGLMQQIVGWISLVSAGVLAVLFLVRPSLRSYPSRLVLYMLVSSMVLSVAFILATFVGGNVGDVWCGDVDTFPATKVDQTDRRAINSDGVCVLQGWCIVLGTLTLAFFWAALSINTARTIHLSLNFDRANDSGWFEPVALAVCIGVPLTLTIIAAAADKLVYEATDTFCFIASTQDYAWRIALWFVPVGLALIVGTAASAWCIVTLVRVKTNRNFASTVVRLLVCIFFFMAVIAVIFASVIYSTTQLQDTAVALFTYMVCIFGGREESVCRDTLYDTTTLSHQYGLSAAATCLMAAAGVCLVVIFGTAQRVIEALPRSGTSSHTSKSRSPSNQRLSHTPRSPSGSTPSVSTSSGSSREQV